MCRLIGGENATRLHAPSDEPLFDLRFDCGPAGNFDRDTTELPLQWLWIEHLSGTLTKPSTGRISIPAGHNVLVFNQAGTIIGRVSNGPMLMVLPNCVTYLRSCRAQFQIARGEHRATVIAWPGTATPMLEAWLTGRVAPKVDGIKARLAGSMPVSPTFVDAVNRLEHALREVHDTGELLLVSVVYEVVARIMSAPDELQIASVPENLPQNIRDLIAQVRQRPSQPWPLREASDYAGYSPFHFSRYFKSIVGYGFHEYVDRCRTETAVRMLLSTDEPIDVVAQKSGFGTTQGLRESVKEYLGLVPSELRALPNLNADFVM